jgi:hypothetical protein
VANPQNSIEELKKRLITGVLLMNLIDQEALGFNLDINQPFEAQRMLLDITRQSFLWLHQKLTSMIEPYEVIANIDIDVHLYNRHLPVASKSALHEEMRKSNIYASPSNNLAHSASPYQQAANSQLSPKTSAFGRSLSSSLTPSKMLTMPVISEAPELETAERAYNPSSTSRNNVSTRVFQQQKTMPLSVGGGTSLSYKTIESTTRPSPPSQPIQTSQNFGQPTQILHSGYTSQNQNHPVTTQSASGQFLPLTGVPIPQNTTVKYFSHNN